MVIYVDRFCGVMLMCFPKMEPISIFFFRKIHKHHKIEKEEKTNTDNNQKRKYILGLPAGRLFPVIPVIPGRLGNVFCFSLSSHPARELVIGNQFFSSCVVSP